MTLWYRSCRFGFRLLYASFFHWRRYHTERVPASGAVILASNHASFLDPPLVGAAVSRPVFYLARESLFRFPPMGAILRSWNSVPVDREGGGGRGLMVILRLLEAEKAVLLFPEGTRTPNGRLQLAQAGIGMCVIKSGAPVIPIRIFGSYEAFNRNHRIPRPNRLQVKCGHPLRFDKFHKEANICNKVRLKQIYQEIADEIMGEIAALEPYAEVLRFP